MAEHVRTVESGEGWAVASLDGIGEGFGFRKIRRELGVTEMGVNAMVLPPHYDAGAHFHERQEEVYFVHEGEIEIAFGDGTVKSLGPGGVARVAAATTRRIRNVSDDPATYFAVGAEGGYVGRDGAAPEGAAPSGPIEG